MRLRFELCGTFLNVPGGKGWGLYVGVNNEWIEWEGEGGLLTEKSLLIRKKDEKRLLDECSSCFWGAKLELR